MSAVVAVVLPRLVLFVTHPTAEVAQQYQARRNELQGIATKIGELEGEADEHRCVPLPSLCLHCTASY